MPSLKWVAVGLVLVVSLVACSVPAAPASTPPSPQPESSETEGLPSPFETQPLDPVNRPTSGADSPEVNPAAGMTLTDAQGAVTVEVTPRNLQAVGDTLDFDITMNTHSVDLSMDLIPLATLSTDTGRSVQPVRWDGGRGGHHVSGTLAFPVQLDGAALLEGATTLTLDLKDVGVPERAFTWEITP